MKSDDFYNAITDLDDEIILEAENYCFNKKKSNPALKTIFLVASCICLLIVVFGIAISKLKLSQGLDNKSKEPIAQITDADKQEALTIKQAELGDLSIGFETDNNSKTTDTSVEIGIRCKYFVPKGEKLIVDVAMCDRCYEYYQRCNIFGPCLDTYGDYGYPVLEVSNVEISTETLKFTRIINDGKVVINGTTDKYQKQFSKEECSSLAIPAYEYNGVEYGKHESIEIDLSNYEVGTYGNIEFKFYWYLPEQPDLVSNPDKYKWFTHAQGTRYLSFLVVEGGVVFHNECSSYELRTWYELNFLNDIDSIKYTPRLCAVKEVSLACSNTSEEQVFNHGEVIEKQYVINSIKAIDNYELQFLNYEGVILLSENRVCSSLSDKNVFTVRFRVNDNVEFGSLNFRVIIHFKDPAYKPVEMLRTVYVCNIDNKDYVDYGSMYGLAKYSAKIGDYLHEIDCQGEKVIYYDESNTIREGGRTTCTLNGNIFWKDNSGANHPAQGVTVEIYLGPNNGNDLPLFDTVTTNSSGFYSTNYSYDSTPPIVRIKVLSAGTNINVVNSSGYTYKYTSNTYGGGSSFGISYLASNSTDLGKSMSVHQAMALANRYMLSLENSYMNSINIVFPSTEGTFYRSSPKYIHILQRDAFDWDVMEHEFGHYVEDTYGILANFVGDHGHDYRINMADHYHNKNNGIRLAWNEGWATYFAINLQKKMNASTMNVPNVGDTAYQDTDDQTISYDIESPSSDLLLGEANETVVSAILYDITDSINTSEADYVSISNSILWKSLRTAGATRFLIL